MLQVETYLREWIEEIPGKSEHGNSNSQATDNQSILHITIYIFRMCFNLSAILTAATWPIGEWP